jgi:hypothetical protein
MTKLANVERIERTIYSSGKFTIKNSVSVGSKGKDDVKLDAIYERQYNSKKYSNKSQLESIHVNTSDFLVFAFNDYQNKINEEIYVSYPHILEIKQMFANAVQMVKTQDMFVNGNVNPKYSEVVLKPTDVLTGKEMQLGGQKTIAIIPHVIQRDEALFPGVLMFLNSEDIYVEMDAKTLVVFYETQLANFDLQTQSALTVTLGLVNKGSDSDSSDAPSFGGGGGNAFGASSNNRAPRGIFGGGNTGGNARGASNAPKFKPPVKNTTLNDLDKAIEGGDISVPSDNDVPFTGGETGGKNFAPKGNDKSPLSLNNIMDAAGEIEIPDLDDGDVDFE